MKFILRIWKVYNDFEKPSKKSLLLLLLLLTTTEALLANVEVFLIALPQENRKDLNGFDTCTFLQAKLLMSFTGCFSHHMHECPIFGGTFFGFCEKVFSNSSVRLQI